MDNNELYSQVLDVINQQTKTIENMMREHTLKIELYIENNVTKRLDSLADGYMLTHEKQWEHERKIAAMLDEMEQMELRIRALENRSA